jgi:phosphoglycerol transferase MdoB-like AlkP superfamily enzyme
MIHSTVILVVLPVGPWLILLLGLQALAGVGGLRRRGGPRLTLLGLVAAGLLLLPIQGFPIAEWLRGVGANFSVPFIGLIAVAVWQREFRRQLFSRADWTASWAFGAVAGLGLYPFALGWGSFDPYAWGWSFSPLFVISAVLTALLVWKQNRFGLLLLLAIAASHLRLLESANYWDYLLDPVYCLASLVALTCQLLPRTRQTPSPAPPQRGVSALG